MFIVFFICSDVLSKLQAETPAASEAALRGSSYNIESDIWAKET